MKKTIFTIALALVLSICLVVGCSKAPAKTDGGEKLATGGVLVLSVNPKIAVQYDENGSVVAVEARNEDAKAIVESCEDLVGKETREAVKMLVAAIGEAGFFVEEIEGERRQITIEIEEGSKLPNDVFIKDIVSDIKDYIKSNDWNALLDLINMSDYGLTDFDITDYETDDTTDYDDTDYDPDDTTDYDDDDDDSDYDPDDTTDYDDTDYDDDDSDYKPTSKPGRNDNDDDTDYDDDDDDDSDYNPAPQPGSDDDDDSDYGDSSSNNSSSSDYDDGSSDFDDNSDSDYDDSDYDD
ncbi:MAG: hypothetical protein GX910_02650 [Clostridiaceae bacterium]|jgi:hypothetical protein|nr:hypothetical protein [Clostridiaceae bacterium]